MHSAIIVATLANWLLTCTVRSAPLSHVLDDPFAVVDPQNWVNPDSMTWGDYRPLPHTNWTDPSRIGAKRNFNIALVTVDYADLDFVITQPEKSTVFGNPQPMNIGKPVREGVPAFYRDLLNKPCSLNKGHTLHEYWMEDSGGNYGVDLTAFGPYRLPALSYQYGITNDMNPGECPKGKYCNINIRTDALSAWRADVGNTTASSFELVFILSAGQDESSTWQEFGQMRFQSREDVPDAFGPPVKLGNETNYARTRYVEWTSWAAAATIWPNAGSGSSTQAESSGMATYAHELSHLLNIGDNYNNPYGNPPQRAYTGPWSMMSRGSFNGPGGPHTRWQVPALEGGSMGSLHTMRDKLQLGLVSENDIVRIERNELAKSGLAVVRATARCVNPPFQWVIDANPQDIALVDFRRPNGSVSMVTPGDYRQLADALFHAGTRSGSEYEYVDEPNRLHFYILERHLDSSGVLSYSVGVRSLDGSGPSKRGVKLGTGVVIANRNKSVFEEGVTCVFNLSNTGSFVVGGNHTQDISAFLMT